MNHFPLHIGDYLRDAGHLSLLEHGVYSRILHLYYLNDGPLRVSIEEICWKLSARSAEEKAAVEVVLRAFFDLRDGGFHNRRCDEEIEKYRAFGEKQRDRANKRWTKECQATAAAVPPQSHRHAAGIKNDAHGMPPASHGNARVGMPTENQEPITKNHILPPNPPLGGKGAVDWFADLPKELDCPEFRAAWLEWVAYRKKIKRPLHPASGPAAFRKAAAAGVAATIAAFQDAMANGWQGSFPSTQTKQTKQLKNEHRDEKRNREYPEQIEIPVIDL